MRSLLIAALIAASPAYADSIARQGNDWVRLTLKPCENAQVVEVLTKGGGDPLSFRAATAHYQGKDFNACWQPAGGGAMVVYEDADTGYVPMGDLKPAPEA